MYITLLHHASHTQAISHRFPIHLDEKNRDVPEALQLPGGRMLPKMGTTSLFLATKNDGGGRVTGSQLPAKVMAPKRHPLALVTGGSYSYWRNKPKDAPWMAQRSQDFSSCLPLSLRLICWDAVLSQSLEGQTHSA